MIHEILPSKKKWKNNVMPCPSIKSPSLWYGSDLFLKNIYYAFIIRKWKKTHFLNGISSENFKFLNCHKFNWCISIFYTFKKIHPRIPFTTLILKYILKSNITFKFNDKYYFVTNIFHMFKFFNVCWMFQNNWLDEM